MAISPKSKSPNNKGNNNSNKGGQTKSKFRFKFNEGTTDAVRRNVYMKHLID